MWWHSIHVHYHSGDFDDLLLDAVRPLFARFAGRGHPAYFVRHRLRGPHLRLNVSAPPGAFRAELWPLAEEVLGTYLAARPSRARPDPYRAPAEGARTAAADGVDGPLLPWLPDNSLHVAPYDRRVHLLRGEAAGDLLAGFLTDATAPAFETLRRVREGERRLCLAFDLMAAAAHTLPGMLTGGPVSFRAHAEWFLARSPRTDRRRAAWNRYYRRHRPALTRRVHDVLHALDAEGPAGASSAAAWAALVASYQRRAERLAGAGLLLPGPAPASAWLTSARLVLGCTYLHLTRLGVTTPECYLLCHLVADAVEDLHGFGAGDRLP